MTQKQPEALRLADALNSVTATKIWFTEGGQAVEMQHIFGFKDAITELRRLHEVNAELLEALKYARRMAHPADCDIGFLAAAIAKAEGENL